MTTRRAARERPRGAPAPAPRVGLRTAGCTGAAAGCGSPAQRRPAPPAATGSATHLVFDPKGGYRDLYPRYDFFDRPEELRAILEEVWSDGLIPVVFLIPDTITPDMPSIRALLGPFLDKTRDLIKVAATGWEVNGWMSPEVMTTAEHAAGCAGDGCESPWWRSMSGVLSGIFYQDDRRDTVALRDRLADFTLRFGSGYNGWPTGFDAVAFEYSAYWEVNAGAPESPGLTLGAAALTTPGPVPVSGFCDGGPPAP